MNKGIIIQVPNDARSLKNALKTLHLYSKDGDQYLFFGSLLEHRHFTNLFRRI